MKVTIEGSTQSDGVYTGVLLAQLSIGAEAGGSVIGAECSKANARKKDMGISAMIAHLLATCVFCANEGTVFDDALKMFAVGIKNGQFQPLKQEGDSDDAG